MNVVDTVHWRSLYFTIQFLYRQLYLDVKCTCQPWATSSNACGTQEEAAPADPWAEEGAWLKRLVKCLPTSDYKLWVVHLHVLPNQPSRITYRIIPMNIFEILTPKMEICNPINSLKLREGQIEAEAPEASLQQACSPMGKVGECHDEFRGSLDVYVHTIEYLYKWF